MKPVIPPAGKRAWAGSVALAALFLLVSALIFLPAAPALAQDQPAGQADAAAGFAVYDARCATCHGPEGQGDGEQAAQLPSPPASLADPAFARQAVPAALFQTITEGRLEQGMPFFGPENSNPLSETSRWDVIAAIYSLSADPEAIARGEELYAGLAGREDLAFLADPAFWRENSNQAAFEALRPLLPDLSEEASWDLVAYGRTFGFSYEDPALRHAPLERVQVRGQVVNGTTGQVAGNMPALLRAFTPELQIALTLTGTVSPDGQYLFELDRVPPDWIYMTSVNFGGISFSSDIARLSQAQPEVDLGVTVFETTSDPSVVTIGQLHVVLDFAGEMLQVNELYTFNNDSQQVFVGETGDVRAGTVRLLLPEGAQNPTFQRGFGSVDSFVPADEVRQTVAGWADTFPLRPGQGTVNLLASYTLPYRDGMSLAHPLPYPASNVTIILPDVGVQLGSPWQSGPIQTVQGQDFLSYIGPSLNAGEQLALTFGGKSRVAGTAQENLTLQLAVGGGLLLLAAIVAFWLVRRWQQNQLQQVGQRLEPAWSRDELLVAIADLDDAFEAGELDEESYRRQRQPLKEALAAMWNGA